MLESLINFYKKRKAYIVLITITALLFFAGFFEPLWYVALGFVVLFYITCNFSEILYYSLYFILFSDIGTFYIYNLIAGFAVIMVKYIIEVVRKKEKFHVLPFSITTGISIVFSIIHYDFNALGLEQGVLVIALLYVAYFAFIYHKQINVRRCFKFLMLGMFVSAILGVFSLLFNSYAYEITYFDGTYKRLKLFSYHQNHLAMVCAFAIAYFLHIIVNKDCKLWFDLSCLTVCLIVGLLTLSKAFIVICVFFALYMIVFGIMKYKLKSLKVIIPALVACLVLGFIFKGVVLKIFDRFLAYETTKSLINRITTGRSEIWYKYLVEITSTPWKLLFGVGLFSSELISVGTHNVLIFFAYRMGLVGLIALGVLCWSYFRCSENKIKFTFKTMLLFLTYIILSFNEMIFSDRFFFFLIISILLMRQNNTKPETIENINFSEEKSNDGEN